MTGYNWSNYQTQNFNPWSWNTNNFSMPNFNQNWNFNPFGQTNIFAASSKADESSTTKGASELSREERIKRRQALFQQNVEQNKQMEAVVNAKKEIENEYIEQADGTYKKVKKLSEASFTEKAATVGSGILNGAFKLIEAFVPKKEDGKTDWGKAALRIGAAVGLCAATFIPVVGPFISAGLLATGVISGGGLVVKGVVDGVKCMNNKDATLDDLKHVTEDITEGGIIVASSVAGIKAMRSSQGVTGMQSAALKMAKSDLAAVRAARASGSRSPILSVMENKITTSWNKSSAKEKFDREYQETTSKFNQKQNDIMNNLPADRKAATFEEVRFDNYSSLESELSNAKSRTAWEALRGKDSVVGKFKQTLKTWKKDFAAGNEVEINGIRFKKGVDDEIFYENIARLEKEFLPVKWYKKMPFSKQNSENAASMIKNLEKSKRSAMRSLSYKSKDLYGAELREYSEGSTSRLRYMYDAFRPNKGVMSYAKAALWDLPMVPWNMTQNFCRTAAAGEYKLETALAPSYEDGMGAIVEMLAGISPEVIDKENHDQAIVQLDQQISQIQNQKMSTEKALRDLYC